MTKRLLHAGLPLWALVMSFVALVGSAGPALGQGGAPTNCEEELRRTRDKLQLAERRAQELEQQLQALQERFAERSKDGQPERRKVERKAEPMDSPDALFAAVSADYTAKLANLPRATKPEITKYQAAVRQWATETARQFRGPVEWNISVEKMDGSNATRGIELTFSVVDDTGKPIGAAVTQMVPARFMRVLADPAGKTFRMTGTAGANPLMNPNRAEEGTMPGLRFIGPYAEYEWNLTVQNIVEVK
ncbi:MAG: hypothetical protein SFZ24_11360 [Planctomycetota bacterium]|nr:hypothetical protein [Planctomycetota bacterium]